MAVGGRLVAAFLIWALLSSFWAVSLPLALRQWSLLVQAIIIGGGTAWAVRLSPFFRRWGAGALVVAGVIEALIGVLQFLFQRPLGLFFFGEPHLDLINPAVAKTIVAGGGRLLRAYGTFVHPNVLAAFLLIVMYVVVHLLLTVRYPAPVSRGGSGSIPFLTMTRRIIYLIALFIILVGLGLTFSRATWLAAAGVCSGWLLIILCRERWRFMLKTKTIFQIIIVVIIAVIFLQRFFPWVFLPKISFSASEPSVMRRLTYLHIGWEILKERPLIGVGIGNQTRYAADHQLYQRFGFSQELFWQPVHNLYLLVAAELGLVGLLLLIIFIAVTLRHFKLETVGWIWLSLLLLGLFDHYLWMIPAGQLMFWTTGFLLMSKRS